MDKILSKHLISKTLFISLFFSIGVIAILFIFFVNPDSLKFVSLSPLPLIGATALILLSHFCGGLRIQLLSIYSGEKLSLWHGIKSHLLGLFSAAVTPSGTGHIPMVALGLMNSGITKHTAWSVGFYTAVIDMFSYAWMLPVAAIGLLVVKPTTFAMSTQLIITIFVISLLLFIGFYILVMKLRYLQGFVTWLCKHTLLRRWDTRITIFMQKLIERMDSLSQQSFKRHCYLQLISSTMHMAGNCILWVTLKGVGLHLPFFETVALTFLILLLSFVIPTPGGSGYAEASASLVVGHQQEMALILPAIVFWRFLTHYSNFIVGSLLGGRMLLKHLSSEKCTEKAEKQS